MGPLFVTGSERPFLPDARDSRQLHFRGIFACGSGPGPSILIYLLSYPDWKLDCSSEFEFSMHRVTARALLVLVLASVIAPVASATLEPEQQPCCCARKCCRGKRAHTPPAPDRTVEAPPCSRQDCSRALTGSLWAELPLPISAQAVRPSALLPPDFCRLQRGKESYATRDVRGPPQLFLA
jgi:hypothetical protein